MPTGSVRALVLERPRALVERTFPFPELGVDDGLLRVEACGLCGTDHEQYTGALPMPSEAVPGHETVGVIEAVGPEAARRWGVSVGARVAVEVFQSCRACAACRAGDYRRCKRHGLADMYGFIPVDRPPSLWGGYAEYLYLAPDALVLPVPEALDAVTATLFNPLGAGLRWGATVPGTKAGDVVVVLGPGMRGLASVVAAKDAGAGFVMVTGLGARDAERLALARDLGADLAVDAATTDPRRALGDATGAAADIVIDVTANAPAAFTQALDLARQGGTVVVAGIHGDVDAAGFRSDTIALKELHVIGVLGVDVTEHGAALDLLASGSPFANLPRRIADLAGAEALVQSMAGEGAEPAPVHAVVVP